MRNYVIVAVLSALAGASIMHYVAPSITKQTTTEQDAAKNNIHTTIHSIKKPDGTTETTTETVDQSIRLSARTDKSVVAARKDWFVAPGVVWQPSAAVHPDFGGIVGRRIIGPFYAVISIDTSPKIGGYIGMEF